MVLKNLGVLLVFCFILCVEYIVVLRKVFWLLLLDLWEMLSIVFVRLVFGSGVRGVGCIDLCMGVR